MTFKKIWKRICCLFHDDRTRIRNGESVEDWEEVQQKRREIEAEKQRKENELLSTWFVRDEYINAGWFRLRQIGIQTLVSTESIEWCLQQIFLKQRWNWLLMKDCLVRMEIFRKSNFLRVQLRERGTE